MYFLHLYLMDKGIKTMPVGARPGWAELFRNSKQYLKRSCWCRRSGLYYFRTGGGRNSAWSASIIATGCSKKAMGWMKPLQRSSASRKMLYRPFFVVIFSTWRGVRPTTAWAVALHAMVFGTSPQWESKEPRPAYPKPQPLDSQAHVPSCSHRYGLFGHRRRVSPARGLARRDASEDSKQQDAAHP
jgi:hypothetical protein